MGNCRTNEEFFFEHRIPALKSWKRVMRPGRNVSFHRMLFPASKERDGFIGLKDFRGDLIRHSRRKGSFSCRDGDLERSGHADATDKGAGLLHKSVREKLRNAAWGYLTTFVTMRAPGDQLDRVTHTREDYPVDRWQKVASPVWMDINPSDTPAYQSARESTTTSGISARYSSK